MRGALGRRVSLYDVRREMPPLTKERIVKELARQFHALRLRGEEAEIDHGRGEAERCLRKLKIRNWRIPFEEFERAVRDAECGENG